jgi:hypothetical protein
MQSMITSDNLIVGMPDVEVTRPAHVPGVRQGNECGHTDRIQGFTDRGLKGYGSAARSTGISAKRHEAVDKRMIHLSPA